MKLSNANPKTDRIFAEGRWAILKAPPSAIISAAITPIIILVR